MESAQRTLRSYVSRNQGVLRMVLDPVRFNELYERYVENGNHVKEETQIRDVEYLRSRGAEI